MAYELKLLLYMKIYSIISVTNLKSFFSGEDLYGRPHDDYPPAVKEENRSEKWLLFEIEKLLDRRIRRYGRDKKMIEYLVK